ncbi:MAG: transcriptional regulator [Gammaproteobacteria bacterium]|nr:transcriptional regulator [Gammaproteobacteria bacterium]
MDAMSPFELDATLHQPIRTRIAAFLIARGEATFTELKKELAITDGNLESHIKKLRASGYLSKEKKMGASKRAQTVYSLTRDGQESFENYLETLKRILAVKF